MLEGAIKITRTSFEDHFSFRARVARYNDFHKILHFLQSDQNMAILGPVIEMELPDHSMTVPEGISIAPAHFLTAPDDDFREHIEGNNHEHHIIKIIVNNGNLEMRLFGSFTRVDDRFSFATPELHNEKLCFLTTGILNKLLFGPDPTCNHCNHGNTKTFVVSIQKNRNLSPH